MAKKFASLTTLQTFLDNLKNLFATKTDLENIDLSAYETTEDAQSKLDEAKTYADTAVSGKANTSHSHIISDVTNLQSTLDGKVPTSRTVNGKPLTANISLSASDVGAASSTHTHDDRYYTETEIDTKISTINTSINNITNGDTTVAKAEEATHATSADSATRATTATTLGSSTVGSSTQPIYLNSGTATKVSYVGTAYGGTGATTVAGARTNLEVYSKSEVDSALSGKASTSHNHDSAYDTKGAAADVQENLDTVSDELDSHTSNTDVHVTTSNKSNWNTAYTHSQAAHARTDATKVADSTTNGNILINGTETNVYSHPNSGVTAGTYKSVTVNAQGHITSGSNPTTLSGYGITDAETKGAASSALASAKEYTDTVASGKSDTTHNHDSAYDAKGAASSALSSAKTYADTAATNAANAVKDELLNGAGTAYDTLKELGDLIDDNADAIDALEAVASGKADKTHTHAIADVSGLQTALDGKAASSHGTHVSYSTTAPVMDGTASVGSASTVARSDHKHPTDTSRASKTEFDTHVADTTKHITSAERSNWNAAKTHADSAHAPSNAEKNQNAFSNITVGSTTVAADTTTDTVTFVGSNVTITPDATNDEITFAVASGSTSTAGILKLTNSTSSTSTTTAATPSSVKSAYDLANTAKTNAATAQTKADSAYSLAEGKVDSLSDLGITATAAELNYVDGVTSNVQEQLDGKTGTSHTHTVSHTPAGTVSKPTFTGSAATSGAPSGTTSVYSITGVGSVPSLSASVTNKCLTLTFSAGSVPTRSSVEVASSDHTHSVTAKGSVSQPTFTGTAASLTTSGAN